MAPTRLLIADDDLPYRNLLGIMARAAIADAQVTLVRDGSAAIEEVSHGGLDVVLTDLHMPGATGIEVARAARIAAPHSVILVLSAGATDDEQERALQAGATACMQKPCSTDELGAMLRAAGSRALRGEARP